MKKVISVSAVVAALMLGSLSLQAKSIQTVVKDSVAQSEVQALKDPSSVKGEAVARAKVEETGLKDKFEAKQKVEAFKKEAGLDEKKSVR